jgi:hypothetical protein
MAACLPAAQAGWVDWTVVTPGTQFTGVFENGSGAYAGTVTANVTSANQGVDPGISGLLSQSTNTLTATFLAHYIPNSGGTLPNLGISYNDSSDSYVVTISFAGLANGYLPAGTTIGFLDIDIEENLRNLSALDIDGNVINSSWLAQRAGTPGFFDYHNSGGDSTGFVTAPALSNAAGVYQFLGQIPNDTAVMLGYVTTQNVSSFSFLFDKTTPGVSGPGGYGLTVGEQVPEPGTYLLSILGLAALGLRQRLRR